MTSSGVAVTRQKLEYDGRVPESSTTTSVVCCCGAVLVPVRARSLSRSSRCPISRSKVGAASRAGSSREERGYGAARVPDRACSVVDELTRNACQDSSRLLGDAAIRPGGRARRGCGRRPRAGPGRTSGRPRPGPRRPRGRRGRRAGPRVRSSASATRRAASAGQELLDRLAEVGGVRAEQHRGAEGGRLHHVLAAPARAAGSRPTNATSARPQTAASSPMVSIRMTGGAARRLAAGGSCRLGSGGRPARPAARASAATASNRSACRGTRISRRPRVLSPGRPVGGQGRGLLALHRAAGHEDQVGRRQAQRLAAASRVCGLFRSLSRPSYLTEPVTRTRSLGDAQVDEPRGVLVVLRRHRVDAAGASGRAGRGAAGSRGGSGRSAGR